MFCINFIHICTPYARAYFLILNYLTTPVYKCQTQFLQNSIFIYKLVFLCINYNFCIRLHTQSNRLFHHDNLTLQRLCGATFRTSFTIAKYSGFCRKSTFLFQNRTIKCLFLQNLIHSPYSNVVICRLVFAQIGRASLNVFRRVPPIIFIHFYFNVH